MLGREILSEPWFRWGVLLVVGFPLLVLVVGEVVARLERRNSALVGPVRLFRSVFLPALVAVLFLENVLDVDTGDSNPVIQVLSTLAAILGLGVLLSLVSTYIKADAAPSSWRARAPRLFIDIARITLFAIGSLLILNNIWGLSITGAFAALGIGGLVIGLALQDTLASLMGGIAILSEKPFSVGDWIDVDGVEGKVTDINWRTVRLRTRQEDLVVVPNIVFGNQLVVNNSRPEIEHVEVISLGFSYSDPPNAVKEMLTEVVEGTPNLMADRPIDIRCTSYDDFSVGYEVWLHIESYDIMPAVRSHFMTRIWYAAKRYGITIPFPIRTLHHYDAGVLDDPDAPDRVQRRVRSLAESSLADPVADELERAAALADQPGPYATSSRLLRFGAGEVLQIEGTPSKGLGIILTGTAVGLRDDDEVVTLKRGDVFGEQGMLGSKPNLLTIRALTDVAAIIVPGGMVDGIARTDFGFAEEISGIVQRRRAAVDRIQLAGGSDPTAFGR